MTDTVNTLTGRSEAAPVDPLTKITEPTAPAPKWFDNLPENLRGDKTIQKYDSEHKALEALVHSNRLLGRRIEETPAEDLKKLLTPQELYDIAHSRGLPSSVDEYKLEKFDSRMEESISKRLKEKAIEQQISPKQLEALLEMQGEISDTVKYNEKEQWRAQSLNKFGDNIEATLKAAQRAVKEFGGEEMKAELNRTGLGDHPMVIDLFAKLGKLMAEDKIPNKVRASVQDELSVVNTEIKALIRDRDFRAKLDSRDPAANARLNALYKRQEELERN